METEKSRAERLMQGFFSPQKSEAKVPLPYDKNLQDGLLSAYLFFNKDRNRWELIGKNVDKLQSCLLIDRAYEKQDESGKVIIINSVLAGPQTERAINSVFDEKIQVVLDQLHLWNNRNLQEYYQRDILMYENLREEYLNFEPVEVYISQPRNPGYDHVDDPKIIVQLHQSLV